MLTGKQKRYLRGLGSLMNGKNVNKSRQKKVKLSWSVNSKVDTIVKRIRWMLQI